MARMRSRTWDIRVAAAFVASLVVGVPAQGAPNDPMDPADCLYPLGAAAENGRFSRLSLGEDPEWAIIDTSFGGATKTYDTVVSIWDTLYTVHDGRYRLGDGGPGQQGGSKHNILVKGWGAKGWNSTVEYPSNPDITNSTPEGNNLNPHAASFQDRLWVVFSRESSFNFNVSGVPIVMRGRASDGTWGPYIYVNYPSPSADNQIPNLIPVGDRLLIVWVHYDLASHIGDTVIQGRFFDGASFGPVFNISRSEDGLADNYISLASDGGRAAVSWLATDTSRPVLSMAPKFALFDGTSWSGEVDLWTQNNAMSWGTAPGFFGGKLYIAFDTTDDRLSPQGDYDLFMRVADLGSLTLSEVVLLSEGPGRGDDYLPDLAVFNGRLNLVWVSDDDQVGAGADLDLILRTFDGTTWSQPRDLTVAERYQDDEYIAKFFVHEGALHVYWITLVKPPGSTTRDQRVATLLVERGARWWDGLEASVEYLAPPVNGTNATARISVRGASGAPVDSPWFSVRLTNGSWQRLEGEAGTYSLTFAFNATAVAPLQVLACGKPIALAFVDPSPPPAGARAPGSGGLLVGAGLATAAAVGLGFVLFQRRRRQES